MDEKCLAIITARGGSKRIPKKNIKEFCGKPIIAYSIQAALESGCFDEVMVSTDDEEIKEIALKYGAKVPFMRSEKTANDYAATRDVLLEVIEEYKKMGRMFEYVCCIYPTAPFITKEKLLLGLNAIKTSDVDTVLPVVAFSFPPQRGFIIEDGYTKFQYPENANKRSQDLQIIYHDAGQFYYLKADKFLESKVIIGANTKSIVVSEKEVQDIDNESDWIIAEMKYKMLQQSATR